MEHFYITSEKWVFLSKKINAKILQNVTLDNWPNDWEFKLG